MRADHAVAAPRAGADGGAPRTLYRLIGPSSGKPGGLTVGPVKRSFPPIVGPQPRLLVLGTLPGEESLRRQQYYAHPRNLFWAIVCALFGEGPPPVSYDERVQFLMRHGIAVWDVVAAGERLASADATIRSETPNPIDALLDEHPGIGGVVFNGGTARRLYDRYFPRRPGLRYLAMPSTSPAYARLDFAAKLACWQQVRDAFDEIGRGL